MTTAATLWSPTMAFSASHRFQSPASSVHLRSSLGLTCRTTASKSLAPATKRCSTIRMVSRFPNGKYIREDYLVVPISLRLMCCFFQLLFALVVLTVLWGAEEGVGQGGAGAGEGREDCPSSRGLLRNLVRTLHFDGPGAWNGSHRLPPLILHFFFLSGLFFFGLA